MGFEVWLAHVPAWLVLMLFAIVPGVVTVALHAIFRRYVVADRLIPHHDVAGFLVGIAGVLYAPSSPRSRRDPIIRWHFSRARSRRCTN